MPRRRLPRSAGLPKPSRSPSPSVASPSPPSSPPPRPTPSLVKTSSTWKPGARWTGMSWLANPCASHMDYMKPHVDQLRSRTSSSSRPTLAAPQPHLTHLDLDLTPHPFPSPSPSPGPNPTSASPPHITTLQGVCRQEVQRQQLVHGPREGPQENPHGVS